MIEFRLVNDATAVEIEYSSFFVFLRFDILSFCCRSCANNLLGIGCYSSEELIKLLLSDHRFEVVDDHRSRIRFVLDVRKDSISTEPWLLVLQEFVCFLAMLLFFEGDVTPGTFHVIGKMHALDFPGRVQLPEEFFDFEFEACP